MSWRTFNVPFRELRQAKFSVGQDMVLQILEVAVVVKLKRHHLNFPVDNHSRICEDVRVRSQCENWMMLQDVARRSKLSNVPLGRDARQGYRASHQSFFTLAGFFLAHAVDRADSTANAAARSDKHASWITSKPARLKSRAALFATCPATVNHADVTARGFPWLGRVPRDSKSAEPRP